MKRLCIALACLVLASCVSSGTPGERQHYHPQLWWLNAVGFVIRKEPALAFYGNPNTGQLYGSAWIWLPREKKQPVLTEAQKALGAKCSMWAFREQQRRYQVDGTHVDYARLERSCRRREGRT